MITKKTVFILGAGSSVPYGFPTGLGLRHLIIKDFFQIQQEMCIRLGIVGSDRDDILNAVRKFDNTFRHSYNNSIDRFLSRNPDHVEIGKTAIIKIIKRLEYESKIQTDPKLRDDDWYSHLFDIMCEDFREPDKYNISDNNISFITFNYDRSLEYFFHQCLTNSFSSIDAHSINKEFSKINFLHVYGKICKLDSDPIDSTPRHLYNMKLQDLDYRDCLDNIHIISEERKSEEDSEIKSLISEAEKIYFLGFDYAIENLETLGFGEIHLDKDLIVFGTAYDKKPEEIKRISRWFKNQYDGMEQFYFRNLKSLELLRTFPLE
ncbi:MAG: hypothetical protein HQ510_06620 [Candidatus Marinimicrobia bacterium]|nr:hypothetical protein [Candidatus Neomarinimicrobiota bacterium]